MFMLAIISLTAVVGSQIASLRYLGLVGVVMGFWRCSDLGQAKRVSNRLI